MMTPVSLTIAGAGAVRPTLEELVASLADPARTWQALKVDVKTEAFARWQKEARLRRVSPMTFFMMEAASQALPPDMAQLLSGRLGIIAVFWTGSLIYSRKFYQEVLTGGPRFAAPNLFPETVFNVPVSHLSAMLGITGAAYSLVGDESSIGTALKVADTWLHNGTAEGVLVVAGEEIDPIALEAYETLGWSGDGKAFRAAEGAGALLVTKDRISVTSTGGPVRRGTTLIEGAPRIVAVEEHSAADVGRPDGEGLSAEAFVASAMWKLQAAAYQGGCEDAPASGPRRVTLHGRHGQVSTLHLG